MTSRMRAREKTALTIKTWESFNLGIVRLVCYKCFTFQTVVPQKVRPNSSTVATGR
jgi:hypothetical protein